ncbi:polo-like protein kinase [Novymonas esmeraldas]|uniref:Serine/threonine-protein kinase PLK n=1 Tax=Novymonas esmeraldas TaxID=1808958 RepID=A0AAW0EY44_9TRYP
MEYPKGYGAHAGPSSIISVPISASDLPIPTFQPGTGIYVVDSNGRQHRFQCGRLLGRGGFAKCYAVSNETGTYALKVVSRSSMKKPKTLQKLLSEMSIHARMKHRHVVELLGTYGDSNYIYLLLELCENGTLMDLLKVRCFNLVEAQYVMLQCLSAMQYMHSECIIHRDLKPANIMLDSELNLKVGDFGLAAELQYDGERKRTVCGTPNYIAPEIIDGNRHGHSYEVDTWSLGVILYTLFVGKPPFQTEEVECTYSRIRQCRYSFPAGVPDVARDLITKILQSSPANRPTLLDIRQHPFFAAPPSLLTPPESFASFGLPLRGVAGHRTAGAARAARVALPVNMHHPPPAPHHLGAVGHREVLRPLNANVSPPPGAPTSPRHLASAKHHPQQQQQQQQQQQHPQQQATPLPAGCGAEGRRDAPRTAPAAPVAGRRSSAVHEDEDEKRQLTALHDRLHQTLCGDASTVEAAPASEVPPPPVWVTCCADFSAKYGMVYRLNTGQTGAHFNDCTKMVWEPVTDRAEYYKRLKVEVPGADNGARVFGKDELQVFKMASYPQELEKKATLMKYFKAYLGLSRVSADRVQVVTCSHFQPPTPPRSTDPHVSTDFVFVKRWLRVAGALVFRLSNKTVQVCFDDGAEMILSSEWSVATYTEPSGRRRTLPLTSVATEWKEAAERLHSTKAVLSQLIRDNCL